ncbi:glycerol-3-phosphate acyltransferase 1, mitochondrial-like isoform X4 [Chiloscyllium plagiosum]|uniref:glycerol-3-phosphate acyltransferase 1, mitochondrial-like isoform X4 n=1 Tax=Chiloscyllium plagiosum TaxID=36176 RepID=UPI001CB8181A|nr:glycerol-3-phosphate acyltransferase 1, mitochondrial-like isoform X4 [Chiloscyllium plagiosum]
MGQDNHKSVDTMASEHDRDNGFVQGSAPPESSKFIRQVNHSGLLSTLAFSSPSGGVSLFLGNIRPFVGRCCYICAPQSWALLFHNHLSLLGFRNAILVTETQTRYRGWLARRLCYFLFVDGCTVYPDVPFLEHKIINNARVQEAIRENSCSIYDQKSTCNMRNVLGIFHQIQATISPLLLRMTSWMLLKIFNWVFVNLQVHRGQIEMLRKASKEYDGPFVFVPLHKSRLDYLLVTFVLFCHSIRVPYFTCGEDVQLPFLRPLLRKLGGIFTSHDHGDHLFQVVLNSYIEELLNEQQSLAVYLKSPVSCPVLSSLSGLVWLSQVFDVFQNCLIPDAVLIPVGVAYDRIVEENYLEQMDYIENEGMHLCSSAIPLQKILLPCVLGCSTDAVYYEKSQDWLLNNDELIQLSKHHRALVADLGRHMLYTASCSSAVMSTTILACLLFHKHQQGIFLSTLAKDFCWLMNEVLARHFDVGFSGKLLDIVLHALFLLRECVILRSCPLNNLIVIPKATRNAVEELSFYSNSILPVFLGEAVAACALNSLLREVAKYMVDWDSDAEVAISQEELICKTVQLCQLLSSETLLLPPCQSVYQFSQEAVDKLMYCEILLMEENENKQPACDTWQKRFGKEMTWKVMDDFDDSESDTDETVWTCYFKLGQTQESHTFFLFLCSLLQPVLKVYETAAGLLHKLDFPIEEPQCVLKMFQLLNAQGEEQHGSATVSIVNSAIKIFRELGVFKEEPGTKGPLLKLSNTFQQPDNLLKLQQYIQQFCD